ncbi:hypothetical protein MTR67_003120 [Solanum verrucosum]|uniref:Uncharacterized protein n=1 Tax=Solanum verrucosum TaxID=315347 RepID=A0AAF0PV04_SOLVR|nr:hypothetical protein MTR67_003120 [Solanum verrucosum]
MFPFYQVSSLCLCFRIPLTCSYIPRTEPFGMHLLMMQTQELMSGIIYATDVATVWADLKERFVKVDGSRGYQLYQEICTITQDKSQRVTAGSYSRGNLGISTALYVGKDQRQYISEGSYSEENADASTSATLYARRGHQ